MKKDSLSMIRLCILGVCISTIIGCSKTDLPGPGSAESRAREQQTLQQGSNRNAAEALRVNVSSMAQLYAALYDPLNEGSTLVLAPGIYRLSAEFPRGGRLELQHNMSLVGQPGNPGAVVIDVSDLPAASYVIPPTATYPAQLRTAPVRMGNGYNSIEWITFTNNPSNILRSMIQTDIVVKQKASDPAPLAQVRIAHSVIKNSSIGINILNRDGASDGRVLEAAIEHNEIFDNIQPQFGSGVQIQNSQGVRGALIKVNLKGNNIHDNRQGLNMFNSSSRGNNRIVAQSITDRLEDNGLGLVLTAGLNSVEGNAHVTGNSIHFEANATLIRDNLGVPIPLSNYLPGGVFISAGNVGKLLPGTGAPGTVHNNTVTAIFKGSRIDNNIGVQINAFGAYSSLPSPLPAGTYNSAMLTLLGVSKQASVNAVASFPVEPAGTNTVTVQR